MRRCMQVSSACFWPDRSQTMRKSILAHAGPKDPETNRFPKVKWCRNELTIMWSLLIRCGACSVFAGANITHDAVIVKSVMSINVRPRT